MTLPDMRDWTAEAEQAIQNWPHTAEGIAEVIRIYEEALHEMQPAFQFIDQQQRDLLGLMEAYRRLYQVRFHADPPPPSTGLHLDTPEKRIQAIRTAALTVAQPGQQLTVESVFKALTFAGQRLIAENPMATIATVLNGFKSDFEKVPGPRGIFKRHGPATQEKENNHAL